MRLALIVSAIASVAGCSHEPFYTGDGKFIDNGFLAYSKRYVIDLGPVDLSRPGTYSYTLGGLPRAEFVVAIRVREQAQNTWGGNPEYPAVVRVHLQNAQKQTAILEEGSLNSWVRSYGAHDNVSELYQRGESRDVRLSNGNTRSERLDVKASGGWGTYFYSDEDDKYTLTIEVLSSSMSRSAQVVLTGWSRS